MSNEFEKLKAGKIYYWQVEDFTDEMKWYLIKNVPNSAFLREFDMMNNEMLAYAIKEGIFINPNSDKNEELASRINDIQLTENDWIQGIKKAIKFKTAYFCLLVSTYAPLTSSIILEMCKAYPEAVYCSFVSNLSEEHMAELSQFMFDMVKEGTEDTFPNTLPLTDEMWDELTKSKCFGISYAWSEYLQRDDVPDKFIRCYLDCVDYLYEPEKFSPENIAYWANAHRNDGWKCYKYLDSMSDKLACKVIPLIPWAFKEMNRRTHKFCLAAIKADVENMQYIQNPSEKLMIEAVKANKEAAKYLKVVTPEVKELIGDTVVPEVKADLYPEKYYLVSFDENLADEGDLQCKVIVKGEDMEAFMQQTFRVSFGNLDDDEERYVSQRANVMPLTEEEYKVLTKFNIECMSGYFSFSND